MRRLFIISLVLLSLKTVGQDFCDSYFGYKWVTSKVPFDSCGNVHSDLLKFHPKPWNLCCYEILSLNCSDSTYEFMFTDTLTFMNENGEAELTLYQGTGANTIGKWKLVDNEICFTPSVCDTKVCFTLYLGEGEIEMKK